MNTQFLATAVKRVLPDNLPPRLLLIFFALAFQTVGVTILWSAWNTDNIDNPFLVTLAFFAWLLWFLLVFLMAIPATDNLLRSYVTKLRWGAMLVIAFLVLASIGEIAAIQVVNAGVTDEPDVPDRVNSAFTYGDDTASIHQAAENLLGGGNPYTNFDMLEAIDKYEMPVTRVTPLQQGAFTDAFPLPTDEQMEAVEERARAANDPDPPEFLSKLCYPAGAFVFVTPFVGMGMEDIRIFYVLCVLVMAAVIFWKCPNVLRPLVVIVFATNIMLWNDVAGGRTDIFYVLLILLGWTWRRHLLLSAVLMGLAAATKQMAWVFVLFYLALQLREMGLKQSLKLAGLIAGTFLAVNIPFLIDAPKVWLDGILAEAMEPYFPRGVGLSVFSVAGMLPAEKGLFLVLEIIALIGALVWYYFKCLKYPHVGLLLAVLPFFFNWHSDARYLYFAPLLIFGAVMMETARNSLSGLQAQESRPIHQDPE
jgi:hypothetical protein